MKAEERKEIETNSLVLVVQRIRKHASGRTAYYALGSIALIVAAVLLYRYFANVRTKERDAGQLQFASANTPEKLKQGMVDHRGTVLGSLFKLELARHMLLNEGLPRLGIEPSTARNQAAASVEQGRAYYLDLTSELKVKDEPMLVQEAWVNAAQAEEALVGLPVEGGTDYRGNPDKAIEYYEKAGSIFPDTEFSKKHKARADKLRANKDQFVADQKAFYKPADVLPWTYPLAPGKKDPFGPQGPILPPLLPFTPKGDVPPAPTAPVIPPPLTPDPKSSAEPKKTPDAKLTPDPKVPADPKKSPDLKPPDPPKVADPKSK